MTRRSFIQIFIAACTALAVTPEEIAPMGSISAGSELDQILAEEIHRIHAKLLEELLRPSPWLALLEPDSYPLSASVTVRERTYP